MQDQGATGSTAVGSPHGSVAGGARWELGSDFDLSLEVGEGTYPWTTRPHSLWGSGRDAIRGLFEWGMHRHGWRRLLMPSYFCQQVVADTRRSVDVRIYPWSPLDVRPEPVATSDGDVVFVPAMFGAAPAVEVQGDAVVIEDHSHDLLSPWAVASTADYAVASLRKTLPLPDGGVAWSPRDLEVPSAPAMTAFHAATVALRLSAMVLKHHYLAGHDVGKQVFRDAALEGERMMASGPDTGISTYSRARLPTLPVGSWRSRRARNLTTLRAEVHELSGARFLDASFAAMLLFDDPARRSAVRQALIAHDVYPSVLWPLEHPAVDGIPQVHVETSRRSLAISVDQRYGAADMQRAATILASALETT